MPVHDWTKVHAGIFHSFHLEWIGDIARVLNRGLLPPDYYALAEQVAGDFAPDVLTLSRTPQTPLAPPSGGTALADAPPKVDLRFRSTPYVSRSVAIRHVSDDRIVAMVELVSPGNKNSQAALNAFVRKSQQFLAQRIHLLIVDLFPPGPRDPNGLPAAILGSDSPKDLALPGDRPLTCAAYLSTSEPEAFINFLRIGSLLPEMPLFLSSDVYVTLPLETTYVSAFESMPAFLQSQLEEGMPT